MKVSWRIADSIRHTDGEQARLSGWFGDGGALNISTILAKNSENLKSPGAAVLPSDRLVSRSGLSVFVAPLRAARLLCPGLALHRAGTRSLQGGVSSGSNRGLSLPWKSHMRIAKLFAPRKVRLTLLVLRHTGFVFACVRIRKCVSGRRTAAPSPALCRGHFCSFTQLLLNPLLNFNSSQAAEYIYRVNDWSTVLFVKHKPCLTSASVSVCSCRMDPDTGAETQKAVSLQWKSYKLVQDPATRRVTQKIYRYDGVHFSVPDSGFPPVGDLRDPRPRRLWSRCKEISLPVPKFKRWRRWRSCSTRRRGNTWVWPESCSRAPEEPKTTVKHLHNTSVMGNLIHAQLDIKGQQRQKYYDLIVNGSYTPQTVPLGGKALSDQTRVQPPAPAPAQPQPQPDTSSELRRRLSSELAVLAAGVQALTAGNLPPAPASVDLDSSFTPGSTASSQGGSGTPHSSRSGTPFSQDSGYAGNRHSSYSSSSLGSGYPPQDMLPSSSSSSAVSSTVGGYKVSRYPDDLQDSVHYRGRPVYPPGSAYRPGEPPCYPPPYPHMPPHHSGMPPPPHQYEQLPERERERDRERDGRYGGGGGRERRSSYHHQDSNSSSKYSSHHHREDRAYSRRDSTGSGRSSEHGRHHRNHHHSSSHNHHSRRRSSHDRDRDRDGDFSSSNNNSSNNNDPRYSSSNSHRSSSNSLSPPPASAFKDSAAAAQNADKNPQRRLPLCPFLSPKRQRRLLLLRLSLRLRHGRRRGRVAGFHAAPGQSQSGGAVEQTQTQTQHAADSAQKPEQNPASSAQHFPSPHSSGEDMEISDEEEGDTAAISTPHAAPPPGSSPSSAPLGSAPQPAPADPSSSSSPPPDSSSSSSSQQQQHFPPMPSYPPHLPPPPPPGYSLQPPPPPGIPPLPHMELHPEYPPPMPPPHLFDYASSMELMSQYSGGAPMSFQMQTHMLSRLHQMRMAASSASTGLTPGPGEGYSRLQLLPPPLDSSSTFYGAGRQQLPLRPGPQVHASSHAVPVPPGPAQLSAPSSSRASPHSLPPPSWPPLPPHFPFMPPPGLRYGPARGPERGGAEGSEFQRAEAGEQPVESPHEATVQLSWISSFRR
ncbi:hypothetical protein WMY93_002061 [Mugilogobius chulae]|uniref:Uncharacterized protein n=1 Tax=Mugilogobius chulae TaxID=88201 RepID=A0AAW0Q136_9GOBI